MNHRMKENVFYMGEALKLAKKGMGYVVANPMVGAIFVKEGKIIGSGYHQKFGGAHAEVNALSNAIENGYDLKGATLYCTLEPCSHTNKKTPPCAQMLTSLGLKKVIVASLDPNPEVSGRGIEILKNSGIEVEIGVLEEEAKKLNKRFFYHIQNQSPYIALKWAQTLDGYVALTNGESKYITSIESRVDVHHDRQFYENILIGGETLRKDNPKLDCRNYNTDYQPNRFVLTDLGKYDHLNYEIFNDKFPEKTFVVTKKNDEVLAQKNKFALMQKNVNVIEYDAHLSLNELLKLLYELKFTSFYVETGSKIFDSFLNENLINELIVYVAPKFFFGGKKVGLEKNFKKLNEVTSWHLEKTQQFGSDLKLIYNKA